MHLDENGVFAEVALTDLAVDDDGSFELAHRARPSARATTCARNRASACCSSASTCTTGPTTRSSRSRSSAPTRQATAAPPPTPVDIAAALDRATRWVERSIDYWAAYVAASRDLLEHNTFTAAEHATGRCAEHRLRRWLLRPRARRGAADRARRAAGPVLELVDPQPALVRLGRVRPAPDELQRPPGPRRRRREGARRRRAHRPGRSQLARHREPADRHGRLPVRGRAHEASADAPGSFRCAACACACPTRIPSSTGRRAGVNSPTGSRAAQRRWS